MKPSAKRSKFSLSHQRLLTCNMGQLVPCGLIEVLPGDSIQQATSLLVRVAPLNFPVMHPTEIRIHHWFVPHRLVWQDWEKFITGGPDGMDASEFPKITLGAVAVGSLPDYYGIPSGYAGEASALPFRGRNLIYNSDYRDQDLQTPLPMAITSGADATTTYDMVNVGWEKDFYTTARPWEQKGADVTLPLGSTAPVVFTNGGHTSTLRDSTSGVPWPSGMWGDDDSTAPGDVNARLTQPGNDDLRHYLSFDITDQAAYTNLSGATAVNVNAVRRAFALQRFEEARARYGSRYVEYLRYLGVKSSDARLQRPEYLGGGKQTLQFSEVLQTGPEAGGGGVGTMRGHGIGAVRSNRYRRFFEEHGYVHSFLSVRPKTIYAQGLHKQWSYEVKEDLWQKELQHIGQQRINNKEIYYAHSQPDGLFGYNDRYDHLKRIESSVHGDFRTTLAAWHMARIFAADVTLNDDFIKCVPTHRINQVTDPNTHNLWVMVNNSIQARRLLDGNPNSYIL